MQLFEFVVFKGEERNGDGKVVAPATILLGPKAILARDADQAKLVAAKQIPDEHMEDLDRLVIACRPF